MTKRVLVVEDNELNLKLFCDLLRAHGHDVLPLRDGRDVLRGAKLAEKYEAVCRDDDAKNADGVDE